MYEVRADTAAQQIRTHEDGHLPPGMQPLQVALLRKARPRPPHPPRASRSQKPLAKSSFSPNEKLLFAFQNLTFRKVKSYLLELAKMANGDYSFSFVTERRRIKKKGAKTS